MLILFEAPRIAGFKCKITKYFADYNDYILCNISSLAVFSAKKPPRAELGSRRLWVSEVVAFDVVGLILAAVGFEL